MSFPQPCKAGEGWASHAKLEESRRQATEPKGNHVYQNSGQPQNGECPGFLCCNAKGGNHKPGSCRNEDLLRGTSFSRQEIVRAVPWFTKVSCHCLSIVCIELCLATTWFYKPHMIHGQLTRGAQFGWMLWLMRSGELSVLGALRQCFSGV